MRSQFYFFMRAKNAITMAIIALIIVSSFKAEAIQSSFPKESEDLRKTDSLSLRSTVLRAQENDDWLKKSRLIESRFEVLSEGTSAFPDPTISLGIFNLPSNGFALNQEPMTQMKLSASQMFPRGKTLPLTEQRYKTAASEQPFRRKNRQLQVALQASTLWFQAFQASANYKLVSDAKPLFDKLGDIIAASYASSSGNANQKDIIRAELELVRLNDRLITLESQKQVAVAKLSQFLYRSEADGASNYLLSNNPQTLTLPKALPPIDQQQKLGLLKIAEASPQTFALLVFEHPLISAMEQRFRTSAIDIDIAKQSYEAQYSVSASYALRDDTPEGQSRADFFSVGVSVNLPLFSSTRQDAQVNAAKLQSEEVRTEKLLIIKELMSGLKSAFEEYSGLNERAKIYQRQILPTIMQQSQAALNSYTNDTGDFAEVVRAKIDELDTQINLLNILVSQRIALSKIDYYLANSWSYQGVSYE